MGQGFSPSWDYLVATEFSRFVTFVRTIENGTVNQFSFIMNLYAI